MGRLKKTNEVLEQQKMTQVHLCDVVPREGWQFVYDYDFGDTGTMSSPWRKLFAEKGVVYPVCLAGSRACPPEDVGGIGRYDDFLEAIANPAHPEHDDFAGWIGGIFDSEAFDLNGINQKLHQLKSH